MALSMPLFLIWYFATFSLLLLAPVRIHSTSNLMGCMDKDYINDGSLSEKWEIPFFHFTINMVSTWIFWKVSPEYKQAFRKIKAPTTVDYSINFIAFFFS